MFSSRDLDLISHDRSATFPPLRSFFKGICSSDRGRAKAIRYETMDLPCGDDQLIKDVPLHIIISDKRTYPRDLGDIPRRRTKISNEGRPKLIASWRVRFINC